MTQQPEIPRLSPTIAHTLISKSPLHAWQQHRLLGGKSKPATASMMLGQAMERLILNFEMEKIVEIQADDFKTKFAKEQRDGALRAGSIPVLASDLLDLRDTAGRVIQRLEQMGIKFTGQSQEELLWEQDGVACKGYLDHRIGGDIYDLKFVDDSSPAAIQRKMVDYGYDIQGAAYVKGFEAVHPEYAGRTTMRFLFCESGLPHAVTVVEAAGSMRDMGDRKWSRAVKIWRQCLATGTGAEGWPSYASGVVRIEALPWQLSRDMEQSIQSEAL